MAYRITVDGEDAGSSDNAKWYKKDEGYIVAHIIPDVFVGDQMRFEDEDSPHVFTATIFQVSPRLAGGWYVMFRLDDGQSTQN